jgi:hypothetical protein
MLLDVTTSMFVNAPGLQLNSTCSDFALRIVPKGNNLHIIHGMLHAGSLSLSLTGIL